MVRAFLKNANIENLIARSNTDYIEKAVYYANNTDKLEVIRRRLFERILETPLFDTKEFSNNFCHALDSMITSVNKNYR